MSKEELVSLNKELFWDISDIYGLNDDAIEERFLKYGNWKNIKDLIAIFGAQKFKKIYLKIKNKKRPDLSEKTINFFNLYLNV